MCFNSRNIKFSIACMILCVTLLLSVSYNTPEPESNTVTLDSIITNKDDLALLHKLGIRNFSCTKKNGTDVIICSKNERKN